MLALDCDYTQAKLIYAATGSLKRASDETGISYDAIRQRCSREDWKTEVQAAKDLVSHRVTNGLGTAALSLETKGKLTRNNHADAALKLSSKVAGMDADELFIAVPNVLAAAKHASVVHGWNQAAVNVGIRLDQIAQSAQIQVETGDLDGDGESELP